MVSARKLPQPLFHVSAELTIQHVVAPPRTPILDERQWRGIRCWLLAWRFAIWNGELLLTMHDGVLG